MGEYSLVRIYNDNYWFVIKTDRLTLNHVQHTSGTRLVCTRVALLLNREERRLRSGNRELLQSLALRARQLERNPGYPHLIDIPKFFDISHVWRAAYGTC